MQIKIKPHTYIYLAVLVFMVPLQWLTAWLIAVSFHEFCHWLCVRLCGGEVNRLTIGLGGANMESTPLTESKNLLAVLSGPMGGFLLLLVGKWFPKVAICSWVLSIYNLLPLLPLDGGRALQILLRRETTFHIVEKIALLLLTLLAIYAVVLGFGAFPLLIICVLWIKNRKSPCKENACRLQ